MIDAAGIVARRARIHGRVQGVGFRFSAARQARALGVSGRIRNLADGTVEVVMAGPESAVQSMLAWLEYGPPMAEVRAVHVEDAGDLPLMHGFTAC